MHYASGTGLDFSLAYLIRSLMKTIEKLEWYLDRHRERVSLAILVFVIALYVCGCKERVEAAAAEPIPVSEVNWTPDEGRPPLPVWVPAGTNPEIRYYYLPQAEVYYDAFTAQFIYYDGFIWVSGPVLPRSYAYVELSVTPVILLSLGVHRPWLRHTYYVTHYHRHFYPPGWSRKAGHGKWKCYDENNNGFYTSSHHWVKGPSRGHALHPSGKPSYRTGSPGHGKAQPKQGVNAPHGKGNGSQMTGKGSGQRMGLPGKSPSGGNGGGRPGGPSKASGGGHGGGHPGGPSKGGGGGHGGGRGKGR